MDAQRNLYIIAGPNGAGKTTASFVLLPEYLGIREFVNADEIARGLSPFNPEAVAFEAGRIMLQRMNTLLEFGVSFAFETTLATRSYKGFVQKAQAQGYRCTLLFFALPNAEMAIGRVQQRVSEGGHNIPTDVIRRRYQRGLQNLFRYYWNVADELSLYDNSASMPLPVCQKAGKSLILQHALLYEYYNQKATGSSPTL